MANRAQSSTSASADASTGRSGGATVRSHSGQGRTVNNLVFLALCMAIMICSFIAFASYPNSPLIWILGLGLYALALLIPVGILQNSTAKKAFGGRTVLMDVLAVLVAVVDGRGLGVALAGVAGAVVERGGGAAPPHLGDLGGRGDVHEDRAAAEGLLGGAVLQDAHWDEQR